jgi:RNA polymerase sigma-70 factor, ECF subfamily
MAVQSVLAIVMQPPHVILLEQRATAWLRRSMHADASARDEDAAMARYAAGDDGAFATVYDALAGRIFHFLQRRHHDAEQCADILQQTFLQMHRMRGSFTPGSPVAPWAFTIARRLLIDHQRAVARQRWAWSKPAGTAESDGVLDPAPGPEVWVRARELNTHLARELETLPPQQREAFELVRLDGMSTSDAASYLGVSVAALKLRCHRAYSALRAALGREFTDEPALGLHRSTSANGDPDAPE